MRFTRAQGFRAGRSFSIIGRVMSDRIRIRRAIEADARGIARVHIDTWRAAYAGILPDRVMLQMTLDQKTSAWQHLIRRQRGAEAVLTAIADEQGVVGFASCSPSAPNGMADYGGEIHTLYVLPDFQDRGLGRALLAACFQTLAASGIEGAFLWVLAENPSRFFYEAMGGHRIGERDELLWGVTLREAAYGWQGLPTPPARKLSARRAGGA